MKRTMFSRGPKLIASAVAVIVTAVVAAATLVSPAWADQHRAPIHTAYCQTFRYAGYVTLSERGVITPGGGGLVCYDGRGTTDIDHHQVTGFQAGEHAGALRYRERSGGRVIVRRYFPHQSHTFDRPVRVESLTISS